MSVPVPEDVILTVGASSYGRVTVSEVDVPTVVVSALTPVVTFQPVASSVQLDVEAVEGF